MYKFGTNLFNVKCRFYQYLNVAEDILTLVCKQNPKKKIIQIKQSL